MNLPKVFSFWSSEIFFIIFRIWKYRFMLCNLLLCSISRWQIGNRFRTKYSKFLPFWKLLFLSVKYLVISCLEFFRLSFWIPLFLELVIRIWPFRAFRPATRTENGQISPFYSFWSRKNWTLLARPPSTYVRMFADDGLSVGVDDRQNPHCFYCNDLYFRKFISCFEFSFFFRFLWNFSKSQTWSISKSAASTKNTWKQLPRLFRIFWPVRFHWKRINKLIKIIKHCKWKRI